MPVDYASESDLTLTESATFLESFPRHCIALPGRTALIATFAAKGWNAGYCGDILRWPGECGLPPSYLLNSARFISPDSASASRQPLSRRAIQACSFNTQARLHLCA